MFGSPITAQIGGRPEGSRSPFESESPTRGREPRVGLRDDERQLLIGGQAFLAVQETQLFMNDGSVLGVGA
jgi:hypothetical protein